MTERSDFTSLFKGGTVVGIGLFLDLGISFIAKLIIARYLGRVDYGAVSLGVTLLIAASVLLVLGLDTGVGRYIPRFDEESDRRGVIVSAFEVAIPVSLAAALGLFVGADWLAMTVFNSPETGVIFRIVAVGLPFAIVLRLGIGTIQGLQRVSAKVIVENISVPITRFSLLGLVAFLGLSRVGAIWAYIAPHIIGGLLVCYYLVRHTPILARVKANRIQGDLLRFSLPLVVSSSAMIIFSDIDVFMLGAMTELGDVGVYNVIYPIAQLLTAPLSAFGFIFMPFASAYDAEDKAGRFSRSYQVVTKWVFLLVFPVFLVISLFPTEVIQLTFGSKYAIGGTALTVLAAGFLANAIGGMNRNVLTALGETRHVMIINVLGAGVNVALNLLLIPRYSYLGAAIATTGSLVFLNAVFSAEVYRQTGAHPFTGALLRPVVAALGLVIGLYALVVTVFEPTLVSIVVMFCLFGILYIVAIVRFGGIEPEEISLLEDMCEEYNVNIGPLQKVFNVLRRGR